MPIKPSDIWSTDNGFPPLETIHRYIEGAMERDELYLFEKQMASSTLLSEAVEGLRFERAKNEKAVSEIDALIDAQTEEKVKVVPLINYRNLAIAASFALLITAGGIYFLNWVKGKNESASLAMKSHSATDSVMVEEKAFESDTETSDASNQAIALAESNDKKSEPEPSASPVQPLESPKMAAGPENYSKELDDIKNSSTGSISSSGQVPLGESLDKELITNNLKDSIDNETLIMSMLAINTSIDVSKDDRKVEEMEMSEEKAVSKSMPAAAPGQRSLSKKKENNADQMSPAKSIIEFPTSIKQLINAQKPDLAIQQLDEIILINDFRKEEALWLKSICLIQKKEIPKAEEILKQISDMNGKFKEKAIQVMETLK